MTAEYYANIYRQYATFMSDWSNSGCLYRIASGASSGDYKWTEVLMRDIPHRMVDGLALHHYSVIDWNDKGSATEFTEQQYFTIMERALRMEELVQRHSTIMDRYDPGKKMLLTPTYHVMKMYNMHNILLFCERPDPPVRKAPGP